VVTANFSFYPSFMQRFILFIAFIGLSLTNIQAQQGRWTADKANAWYARQPFLFGANYNPANAINELEMFQAESFDPKTIDKELRLGRINGREYATGFSARFALAARPRRLQKNGSIKFLSICQKHKIRPMLVLFDSCWDPHPKLGKQRDPQPGIHNSGWLQKPRR